MESTNPTEADFQSALATEFGIEDTSADTPPETTPPAEEATPPAAQAQVPPADDATPPVEGEPAKPEGGEAKVETPEEIATRESEAAAEASAKANQPATKEDIAAALREYNESVTGRVEKVSAARNEVISKLYPEGIDKTIYDTNGNAIKTAQDIVDRGLINERTGEAFEYEEAASFMLEAQQKMNQNVEELNNWAEKVAEDNINLLEGNQRVMEKWGKTLETLDKATVEKLAETYITKQLKFDDTNSYITEMNMAPEEFYDMVMAPYSQLTQALAQQQAAQEAAQTQAQVAEQSERTGLPPQRGASDVKANTGDPMLDALVDELKKG